MEDYLDDELPESVGGPAIEMSIFEMVPKLFLSDQTSVWFNIIDHNMSIKVVKGDIFFHGSFCRWFLLGK